MKFTESQLEQSVISLLAEQGIPHTSGLHIHKTLEEVLLKEDLKNFLYQIYADISPGEVQQIILKLEYFSSSALYESNRDILRLIADGFTLKREDASKKDLFIQLIDYSDKDQNIYHFVNQLEIKGSEKRIPDGILYINGIPLVVFEFKTAIQENTTIHDAYKQLTIRYKRDIPELLKYNAFLVLSDGVNNKAGSLFAPYEFFYGWRKAESHEKISKDGIASLYTMIKGLFNKDRLRDVIHNFIFFPDTGKKQEKIVCRYPQYYASRKLYENILAHRKPLGDGKGGTYFGATGCGKSYTMLYLSRLLMRSTEMASPTIILITDRTDLDEQLSGTFTNAKNFIGDNHIVSVESREDLRNQLRNRESGGVFLTTIHKFAEDTELLSERNNIICISDEAHRSQINLDKNLKITDKEVKTSFGFAYYLHQSLPNATYVGFTGTPIDKTFEVFGDVVDAYTMNESVQDEITVRIVYEGRASKVILKTEKLKEIEEYYAQCVAEGSSEYQVEESKKATTGMNAILGDKDRLKAVAEDFVKHYENRVNEGATVCGKAMFVSSSREIAYNFYKELLELRPEWGIIKTHEDGIELSEKEMKELKPIAKVNMVMTRDKDDEKDLYELLGTKDDRKELDRQFKQEKSNFKIAIVVDMWLTGFDVPFLDSIYIDKPIQEHSLIQTISRVNRKFKGKDKGLVVDYIGIKNNMNYALAKFNKEDQNEFEDIDKAITIVKDQLDLLRKIFHNFNTKPYFEGSPVQQLENLNLAAEFVQTTEDLEKRFMRIVRKMKEAYNICCSSEAFTYSEKEEIHYFVAIRSIIYKLTKKEAPDIAQMNARVAKMVEEAVQSDGVEEVFKMDENAGEKIDIFGEEYLERIDRIKLPNTKIKILQRLLKMAIDDFKKVNKVKGVDFTKRLQTIVDKYNERSEDMVLANDVLDDLAGQMADLLRDLKTEKYSFEQLGIDFEEKSFYDILKEIRDKYKFEYPEEKLIALAKDIKIIVDDKAKYTDWSEREDIKAELKVDLILKLAEHGYPPVTRDEVYKEIFEQAENFRRFRE
ncbi:type I restriction endonuclease [Chryseobacterium sp. 6424]|uniref:type I restriction endonuclease subunit R n=1 Tax=Chryseobacterium sp. 6424 TaxID=2039166 RepID=UPI000EFB6967|nr:type I restriction endonuclease subunit R [Chryseobacterium sp. 6424]AYO58115.1 type I restriction endonuclease [Chryseobacterium sp. 6424]